MPRRGSGRCVPRSNGATTCSRPTSSGLFARLSVFAGGCTLEAAATVCGADLDTLQSLVDKSLVRHTEERFWMLETIREFALERLEETGGAEVLRERYSAVLPRACGAGRPRAAGPELVDLVRPDRSGARQHPRRPRRRARARTHRRRTSDLRCDQAFLVDAWLLERGPSLARVGACSRRGERPTASLRAALGRRSACHLAGGRRAGQRRGGGDARPCRGGRSQRAGAMHMAGMAAGARDDLGSGGRALRGVGTACARARRLRASLTIAVNNLGTIASYRGDYERALELFEESPGDQPRAATIATSLRSRSLNLGTTTLDARRRRARARAAARRSGGGA